MPDLSAAVLWWIAIQMIGLAAWPLSFRLLAWLPDRGYGLAKPLGLLLFSYAFWLLVSIGVVPNTPVGMLVALALVVALAWLPVAQLRNQNVSTSIRDSVASMFGWLRTHLWLVIAYELLFVVAYAGWAVFRAHNPDLVSGEKQMEFAFFNAVGRSASFPPHDPWLAGYTLPYYYLGYVMMSLLAKLSGVSAGVAFSLSNAMWFALSAASAFGVVVNLVLLSARTARCTAIAFGSLGAVFLVLMGNLEAPLEVARAAGWGTPEFWTQLDIVDLNQPYLPPADDRPAWPPREQWWWRASRVIHDYHPSSISPRLAAVLGIEPDPGTYYQEMIDEFPQFTFLYGDMHPHVLNLPFVLVALGLTLNLFQAAASGEVRSVAWGRSHVPLRIVYPIVFGALGFLNAWDFPIYLLIATLAFTLGRYLAPSESRTRENARSLIWIGIRDLTLLSAASVLLYYPFYGRFASPVSGIAPNIFHGTSPAQFFVMFGPFVVIASLFGLNEIVRLSRSGQIRPLAVARKAISGGILLAIVASMAATALGLVVLHEFTAIREWFDSIVLLMQDRGITVAAHVLARLSDPWLVLSLGSALAMIVLLWHARRAHSARPRCVDFALLLLFAGALLTYMAEFVFVVDLLKTRANTIFKLYYQTCVMWSVAAAYGAYEVLGGPHRIRSRAVRFFAGGLMVTVVGAGLMYPALAIPTKIDATMRPTLDAQWAMIRSLDNADAVDAYAAAQWLNQHVSGAPIILEASDGAYTYEPDKSRLSAWTGLPTLVGWYWHEVQWRGTEDVQRQRLPDIETIYSTSDAAKALALLRRHDVRYVYVGPRERRQYSTEGLAKFDRMLPMAFRHGTVTLYYVPTRP